MEDGADNDKLRKIECTDKAGKYCGAAVDLIRILKNPHTRRGMTKDESEASCS
jgi:hypothetical protein